MAALGPFGFAVLVWGAVGVVLAVFVYEAYVVATELVSGRDGIGDRSP